MRKNAQQSPALAVLLVVLAVIQYGENVLADPFKPAVLASANRSVDLRTGKSPDSASVGLIKPGDIFYVAPSDEDWWLAAAYDNQTGFLRRSSVRIIKGRLTGGAPNSSKTPADIDASATSTDKEDQYVLGLKFARGIGVPTNPKEAARYFAAAADQGHMAAKADLGRLYFKGEGVKRDRTLGVSLISEGVAKGDARSLVCKASCMATEADELRDGGMKDRVATEIIAILERVVAEGGEDGVRAAIAKNHTVELRTKGRVDFFAGILGGVLSGSGEAACPRCGGTGREFTPDGSAISGLSCERCGGSGYVK